MLDRVAATVSRYGMLPPDTRVIVAVSGGPDSVCLLHVLRELGVDLTGVAHFNHKLRGEASEEDQRFVAALARDFRLKFYLTSGKPPAGNLEQSARRERLKFFRALMQRGLADRVALGHTMDDQAETVLFRLLRGSGLAGLAGILPVTAEGVIRPLLGVSRDDVLNFLRSRAIPWREDSTNLESRFARNRIRNALLPQLKREWNPRVSQILAQTADLAYEEELSWAAEIARRSKEALVFSEGAVEIPAGELTRLPRAVARRLVRHAIRQTKGNLHGVEFGHVEQVLDLPQAGTAELPGIRAMRSFDWVRLEVPVRPPARLCEGTLEIPGCRPAPDGNSMICLELIRGKRGSAACATLKSDLYFRKIPEGLVLRGWRPGDRYRPVGHTGEWKLKELFQRQRVPSWRRQFWPILSWGDKILWARHFGPAAEYAMYSGSGAKFGFRIREIPAEG